MARAVGADNGRLAYDPGTDHQKTFGHGVLHVLISRARGIKGDEIRGMGRADPYLKVKHGSALRTVTLQSQPHVGGGSSPIWNHEFHFPIRNGGTEYHNILEIEIWNRNTNLGGFRPDNTLGHVRIGGLANWIYRFEHLSTDPAWYPVFYKNHPTTRGEILMKFYFQTVNEGVFANGHHAEASYSRMEKGNELAANITTKVNFQFEEGSRVSRVLGHFSQFVGAAQPLILLLTLV